MTKFDVALDAFGGPYAVELPALRARILGK